MRISAKATLFLSVLLLVGGILYTGFSREGLFPFFTHDAEAALATVTEGAASGWDHSSQRNVFYNGENFFLLYATSTGVVYKSSSDNVTWTATSTVVDDANTDRFDTYVVNDTTFDLIYTQEDGGVTHPFVRTCSISGSSITCGIASAAAAGSGADSVTVVRTASANRIYMVTRDGNSLEVWSADQTGDASGISAWTQEISPAETQLTGELSAVPYESSDEVLVMYQKDSGGSNNDGVFARVVTPGSGGAEAELGNLNNVGTLSNPVRISGTDFRYVLKNADGAGGSMIEYIWNDVSWSASTTIDAETDQESFALVYDQVKNDLYLFSVDTATDDIEQHKKVGDSVWGTEVVVDNAEGGAHTAPIVQMHESPYGSSRTLNRQLVFAYRVSNGAAFDLVVGNTLLSPALEQSAYRLFDNDDSTQVGAISLAAINTSATLSASNAAFRLRLLLHAATNDFAVGEGQLKLQFAAQSGTCDASFVGETYTDVTALSVIAFNDNTTPSDGDALTASSTDPTHGADSTVNQTYEELNNFTTTAIISAAQDGQWDFALEDNYAPGSTAYCFRVVQSDGTLLSTYTTIPEITTSANTNPTVSSAAHQTFEVGQSATAISTITVTDNATPSITVADDLRIAIATSSVDMLWLTSDDTASFGGTASGKVSNPVSYEGGGSVLVIPVGTDFSANDTLTISDLSFTSFSSVNAPTAAVQIYKDGASDAAADAVDDKTVAIKGALALADHDAGTEDDKFTTPSSVSDAELLSFKLSPTGEAMTVNEIVVPLSAVDGFSSSAITDTWIFADFDGNGAIDGSDAVIGGTGSASISGSTGTITFGTSFATSSAMNYILRADVSSINGGDELTIGLPALNVDATGSTSGVALTVTGTVTERRHSKTPEAKGGGGGVGGGPPAGAGNQGGGGSGGGELIGEEVGFLRPTSTGSPVGEWTSASNAYDTTDGTYATEETAGERQDYADFVFGVPSGNTISGLEVKLEASRAGGVSDIDVELSWDGGTSYTTAKNTGTLAVSDTVYSLGGAADLWGRTWTDTELSDANFRLRVTGDALGGPNAVQIDEIQVKVTHVAGGGGGGGGGEVKNFPQRFLAGVGAVWKMLVHVVSDIVLAFPQSANGMVTDA